MPADGLILTSHAQRAIRWRYCRLGYVLKARVVFDMTRRDFWMARQPPRAGAVGVGPSRASLFGFCEPKTCFELPGPSAIRGTKKIPKK
jgi:hypothetical protein